MDIGSASTLSLSIFDALLEHLRAVCAQRRVVRERERGGDHPGAAHLPPVVARLRPPSALLAGVESVPRESLAYPAALVLGKPVVQPVVSDRHCERHLARVEEVARVPVRERADGIQLGEGAFEVPALAGDAVRHRERRYAVEGGARGAEKSPSRHLALDRQRPEKQVGALEDALQRELAQRPLLCGGLYPGEPVGPCEEPRVPLLHGDADRVVERLGPDRSGYGQACGDRNCRGHYRLFHYTRHFQIFRNQQA